MCLHMRHKRYTFIVDQGDVSVLLHQLFDHVDVGGLHSIHEGCGPSVTLEVDVRLGEIGQKLQNNRK